MRLKSFGTFEKQAPDLSRTKLGSKVLHYHQRSDKVLTTNLPHSNITSPCLLVEICSHNFSEHTKHSPLGKTKNDYSPLTLHFINKEEISKDFSLADWHKLFYQWIVAWLKCQFLSQWNFDACRQQPMSVRDLWLTINFARLNKIAESVDFDDFKT